MTTINPAKLGFCMAGLEHHVAEYVASICERFARPTYVEIGVGHGQTLVGVATMLADGSEDWRAIGIELPDGYSFDREITKQNATDKALRLEFFNGVEGKQSPPWNQISVLLGSSQVVLSEHWTEQIHLALIDGCHGKECATMDFLTLEPFVPVGGLVMFHDFGREQVGQHQPHCGRLDVRGACKDLGLLNNQRNGWKYLAELSGNKSQDGANMGVFERI